MSSEPFDDLAACARTSSINLLIGVAGEFGAADAAATQRMLDDFALPLFGLADSGPVAQAEALLELMAGELGFSAARGDQPEHMLLPRVVDTRRGHALMLAVVARELASRAGISAVVLSSPRRWFVGLEAEDHVLLFDASLRDAEQPREQVRAHCRHELACCALTALHRSFAGTGQIASARRASRLKLSLPIGDELRAEVARELSALDRSDR